MDDYKVIFYIIGGIIYLILQFRGRKKAEEPAPATPSHKPATSQPPKQHKNVRSAIDEILERERNLTTPPPAIPKPKAKKAPAPVPAATVEVKSLEKKYKKEKAVVTHSLEKEYHNTQREIDRSGKKFDVFATHKSSPHPVVTKLRSPQGIRDAIIAAEVLTPKHF